MIVDGRSIASELLHVVKERAERFGDPLVVRAVVANPSPATESYLKVKADRAREAGMRMEVVRLKDATESEVFEAVTAPGADAVIVQLPLPASYSQERILNAIPTNKDADCLSAAAVERFERGTPGATVPPVAAAVSVILERAGVVVEGKRAVVVGKGKLVGKPVAKLLEHLGANVSILTKEEGDDSLLKEADIVVLGAGVPRLVKPEQIKEGVVILDAGTSEEGGAIVGDADPACAQKASVFTPVPGGIGPVAVACLFENAVSLAEAADLQAL